MIEYRPYEDADLTGIIALCDAEGWPSLPSDRERAHRVLTNPGVTAYVAVDGRKIVGFVYLLSDGEIQAYVSSIAVDAGSRGLGIGTQLIRESFAECGAERADLLSEADGFYDKLVHRKLTGYRIYPPFRE